MVANRKRSILIDLVVDDSEGEKLNRLGSNVEKSAGSLGTLATSAKLAIGTVAGSAITKFVGDMADMAVQAEATTRRSSTVFGANAGDIERWAERTSRAFGLSTTATIGQAAAIGDLLIPLGFTREQAAELAPVVAEAGNAFAEFTGQDTQFAIEAIGKALLGEREQLKSLGVVVREEDLRMERLTGTFMGLEGATAAQGKALDTLNLIFERGADAITAYEDRSDSLTAKQKEMQARLAEVRDELAQKLAPAFLAAFEAAGDFLGGVELIGNRLAGIFSGAADQQVAFIEGMDFVKDALGAGEDPAVAFANAIAHVARVGDITREKVDSLRAAAGLSDEQFHAARQTLVDYAASGAEASITVDELNEAMGINEERAREALDAANQLKDGHIEAARATREHEAAERARFEAMFLTEEQSKALGEEISKQTAEYEKHAEVVRRTADSYRLDLTPAFDGFVTLFDGKVDELELSIEDIERMFAEQQEQNRSFFNNLSILAAAGLDDLVAELEAKGPAAAGAAQEYVANMDEAFEIEQALETGKAYAAAYADGIATSFVTGLPPVLRMMEDAGISMARALEAGFDSTILGGSFFFDVSFESFPGAFVGSGRGDSADNGGVVIE